MPTPEVSSGGLAADEEEETWVHSTVFTYLVSNPRFPTQEPSAVCDFALDCQDD